MLSSVLLTWTSGSSHPTQMEFLRNQRFVNGSTERMRIRNDGYTMFSSSGSFTFPAKTAVISLNQIQMTGLETVWNESDSLYGDIIQCLTPRLMVLQVNSCTVLDKFRKAEWKYGQMACVLQTFQATMLTYYD